MLAFLKPYQFAKHSTERTLKTMIGEIPHVQVATNLATVKHAVSQSEFGRVSFQGVSWRAVCCHDITCPPGTLVRVLYRQGNTLVIEASQSSQLYRVA